MSRQHPAGWLITGTDTGVGKTAIGAAIVKTLHRRGVRVGAYKPVASGSVISDGVERWEDVEAYYRALQESSPRDLICPQTFTAPLAPPVAARAAGRSVDAETIEAGLQFWKARADCLVVEGAGGLLSPITDDRSLADFATSWQLPLLIIARRGLGTINHTLLTVEVARQRGLPICGIILNATAPDQEDLSTFSNRGELVRRCTVPVLGEIPYWASADLPDCPEFLRIMDQLFPATTTAPFP